MTDKERLEEIKDWFYNNEEMHEFQIDWLIRQVEELGEAKNNLIQMLKIELNKVEYLEKFMDDFITNYQARFYGNE